MAELGGPPERLACSAKYAAAMEAYDAANKAVAASPKDETLLNAALDAGGKLYETELAIANELMCMLRVAFKNNRSALTGFLAEILKHTIEDMRNDVKEIADAVVAIRERQGRA